MSNIAFAIVGLCIGSAFVIAALIGRNKVSETETDEGLTKTYPAMQLRLPTGARSVSIAFIFFSAALLYWLFDARVSLAGVGDWSWDHWSWLLILWGVLAALIAINATSLGKAAPVLQKVLVGAMIMVFMIIPGGFGIYNAFLPQVICHDVSAYETRSCVLNATWSTWVKFADGPIDNGKQICFSSGARFDRRDVNGTTFWRFKTENGRLAMQYRLFPANEPCPDVL